MVVCQMINYIIFQIFRCYYVVLIGGMNQWNEVMRLITDTLPSPQVKALQFSVHISFFTKLQKSDFFDYLSSSRNVKYLIYYRISPCFSSAKALRYRTPQHKRCGRDILFPSDSLLSGR